MAAKSEVTVTGTASPTRPRDASGDATVGDPASTAELLEGAEPGKPRRYGRYEVIGALGAGGMGVVLEARDPALNRKVALKLLHPRRSHAAEDGARRLALEAQAMARLAHPNVVTVYEIDRVGDQVYVAMELVAGTTLRGWLRERPRRWREVVEMFVAAGRGLAAAHAAGLVHRDFKPDNVLIGRDGRPRVCDFGLVVETSAEDIEELVDPDLDGDVTFRGSAAGTPAYMSAERWTGDAVDARSDQFAFCVALWEAVYGQRPFAGSRPHEVSAAVRRGEVVEPPRRPGPRWLSAMLRRGLAVDPQARWPDMATLLDALARGMRAVRRRTLAAVVAGVAIAVASAAITVAVLGERGAPDPCAPPADRLAAVWNPVRGDAMRARLATADPAQGAVRFTKIAASLDADARAWSDMHVSACRATRIEGRQSDTLLDRRMECLDRWLVELRDTVEVIEQARRPGDVDSAVRTASQLSPLAACADANALLAAPPPSRASDRATALALVHRSRELDVEMRAGYIDGAPAKATELVAAARALGHLPTLIRALIVQVGSLNMHANRTATVPFLRELVELAARVHDDRSEALAWRLLLVPTVMIKGKVDDALALVPAARAAVLRAGDPIDLHADLLVQQGIAQSYGPRPGEALPLFSEARHLLVQAGAEAQTSPLAMRLLDVERQIGTTYLRTSDYARAAAIYRGAAERARALSGVDSLDEAFALHNLAIALQYERKLDESLVAVQDAVRIRQARSGDSSLLATSLSAQGDVLGELGRLADALAVHDRAMQINRAVLAPGDTALVAPLIDRGQALVKLDRLDDAARDFTEAVRLGEAAGTKGRFLAYALANRGEVAERRGRCNDALADYDRALALLPDLAEPTDNAYVFPLVGKAACLVKTGQPAAAIPLLERALRCDADDNDALDLARARAYLGRALVATRRDVAGGLVIVRAARAELIAARFGEAEVRQLDLWLAGLPR